VRFDHIKGIIWDLDNTLYRFDQAFINACNHAAAKTICTLIPDLSFDQALDQAEKSYQEHGFSGHSFVNHYGGNYQDYHFTFHETIDEKILQHNEEMNRLMADLNLPHAIITNASRHWAHRALNHLGLRDFFPDDHIIPLEDSAFEPKARSRKPFEMACAKLNLKTADVLMVEDTARNLKVAKDMGMTTVLIHHGHKPEAEQDFIDLEFSDTVSLMRALI